MRGGKRRDKRCGITSPLPQIHHQEVLGESGTEEQVRDPVVRVSALGGRKGRGRGRPCECSHLRPTRNKSGAATGPLGGGGEEIAFSQQHVVERGVAMDPVGVHSADRLRNR